MALHDLFWRQITAAVVRHTNVIQRHRAPSDADYVRPIPIGRRYPGLAGTQAFLSENTPESEGIDSLSRLALHEVLTWKETYGLVDAFPAIWNGDAIPYPAEYLALGPAPVRPEDFAHGADRLAGIARRGPLSMYLQPDGVDGRYKLDMTAIESLEPRPPFVRVGGLARFERRGNVLTTSSIDFQGATFLPDASPAWALAEKRILVALNTHSTFIDHLTNVHILGGGTWSICTHLALSARHPLRILFQPFTVETMRVNNDNIDGLIKSPHSNVPSYSGYSLAALDTVMRDAVARFDVRWFDAEYRARSAGQFDDPMFPTMESAVALWRIFRTFSKAWCIEHLPDLDIETRIWCQELDARIPNGVSKLLGIDDLATQLTVDHVAYLAAVGMFTCSVWHHVVANMMRDYEMQFDVIPPAMNADGHPTLGIVLEKRNSITIASLLRYRLVDDSVFFTLDSMRVLWRTFQDQLKTYERSLAADPSRIYRVTPSAVPSSVHA